MAHTQTIDAPAFSRIVSKGRSTSWTVGLPFGILVIALIAGLAYFASKAGGLEQRYNSSQQQIQAAQTTIDGMQKRLTQMESDLAVAHSPGTTTVLMQPASKDGKAWGSAILGETAGKGFLDVRAYGLEPAPQGKAYQVYLDVADAKAPQFLGTLDPGPNGAAFSEGKDVPASGKAKRVFVVLADETAKDPGKAQPLMQASLQPPAEKAADEE